MHNHTSNGAPADAVTAYFTAIKSDLDLITILARNAANSLGQQCKIVRGLVTKVHQLQGFVTNESFMGVKDYTLVWGAIDAIHENIVRDLSLLNAKQVNALKDAGLTAENEQLVCESYHKTITAFKVFYEAIEELRWDFLEAQADGEGQDGTTYESVDELMAALTT